MGRPDLAVIRTNHPPTGSTMPTHATIDGDRVITLGDHDQLEGTIPADVGQGGDVVVRVKFPGRRGNVWGGLAQVTRDGDVTRWRCAYEQDSFNVASKDLYRVELVARFADGRQRTYSVDEAGRALTFKVRRPYN